MMLHEIMVTAQKEFRVFFASPSAYIFLGAFLAINLFIFFWGESFFTRNIADLRPMFSWMPIITIFLSSALTMRSWADERRSGTFETLMTSPTRSASLVLGKFLAVKALVALALLGTLPLAFIVNSLGVLDWGPVIGGYVATLCLAAAYLSIGLFVSAQTDNSVVSLILTVLISGAFYIVGSDVLTGLFSRETAGFLLAIGTGARFNAITRGVLDLRDLYYYLSIVGVFLTLNLFQLYRLRRAGNPWDSSYKSKIVLVLLVIANLVSANLWMSYIARARSDLTAAKRYTLSDATIATLSRLEEPLLIRGYFSSQTHPLLAPLVPQIQDLLVEYSLAKNAKVRIEIVNPTEDSTAEQSAAQAGIRPTPFQTASRYKSSVVSSYFDILVSYGDAVETLDFRDLIDVKGNSGEKFEVGLANPEYALTSAIKKVVRSYQSGSDPFAFFPEGIKFTGYLSPESQMPQSLRSVHQALISALEDLTKEYNFTYEIKDPDAQGGTLAKKLSEVYGFVPQIASLRDAKPFWFSLRVQGDGGDVPVVLPESGALDSAAFKLAIRNSVKRLAPGLLRSVAIVTPLPSNVSPSVLALQPGPRYTRLREQIGKNFNLVDAELSTGHVPDGVDVLMVLAPSKLQETELFAIDQFLMRGGTVVVSTSNYTVNMTDMLSISEQVSGLEDWLSSYGITIDKNMVLDSASTDLPIPVERTVDGYVFKEVVMLPYPYFPDVRADGLAQDHPVTASLSQVTVSWASPILIDSEKIGNISSVPLIKSSSDSWLSSDPDITPDYEQYPNNGFSTGERKGSQILAVAMTGRFSSFFSKKDSPLLAQISSLQDKESHDSDESSLDSADNRKESKSQGQESLQFRSKITHSPEDAKLIVISSSDFASDVMLGLASRGSGSTYMRPIDFFENIIDWATEDPSLLALRGKTQFVSTLEPISSQRQLAIEYISYASGVLALFLIWVWRRIVLIQNRRRYMRILNHEVKA